MTALMTGLLLSGCEPGPPNITGTWVGYYKNYNINSGTSNNGNVTMHVVDNNGEVTATREPSMEIVTGRYKANIGELTLLWSGQIKRVYRVFIYNSKEIMDWHIEGSTADERLTKQ